MKENLDFDFNEILEKFKSGKKITSKGGLLAPPIKQLTKTTINKEISGVKEWQSRPLEPIYPF